MTKKRVRRNASEEQMSKFQEEAARALPKAFHLEDDYGEKYIVDKPGDITVEDFSVLFNTLVMGGYGNHVVSSYHGVELISYLSAQLYREENAKERAARLKREEAAKKKKEAAAARKKAKDLKLLKELQEKYGTV